MNFKSIAFSGVAVLAAVVMSLGMLAQPAAAATTVTTAGAVTVSKATNAASGTGACTALATSPKLTEGAAGEITGTLTLIAPAGWTWCTAGSFTLAAPGVAGTATTALTSSTVVTATITAVSTTAGPWTWSGLSVRPNTDATATGNITTGGTTVNPAAATVAGALTIGGSTTAAFNFTPPSGANALIMVAPGTTCDAAAFAAQPAQPVTVPADGSAAWVPCTRLLDDVGNPAVGAPVLFTVSLGIVSTGTAKTINVFANSTGYAGTTYRGTGNNNTTDSVVATYSVKNAVATQTITLAAASGGTASKIAFNSPVNLAVAATVNNVAPGYVTTKAGTDVALQVQDAAGLGVNSQVLLLTVDKGGLIAGFGGGCPSSTKSITSTTATGALAAGGTDLKAGVVQLTFCANQTDAVGKATITAQNITTSMANGTTSISMAGRPAKVEATATGNAISAKVTDAAGNAVADGTPIRFTISANAGAVSTACTTSTNGQASSVVSLIAATGTVIVSTDWSETGAAATCAAAGAQQAAASVTVPGGTASSGTPATPSTPSAGSVTSGSVPAAGGFGFFVYGGPVSGLAAATSCPAGTAAFWATVNGEFVTNVPGTTISAVNAAFNAAFPNGIPAGTALLGKCK